MDSTILWFIFGNIALFSLFLYISFRVHNYYRVKRGEKPVDFVHFFNRGDLPPLKNLLLGMTFGMVFGFMDNFGLWMGIDALEKYLPGGVLTKAALGNTYSDLLGAVVGTSIAIMAKDAYNYDSDDDPIWVDTLGIVLGCLLGMFTGRMITGKQ